LEEVDLFKDVHVDFASNFKVLFALSLEVRVFKHVSDQVNTSKGLQSCFFGVYNVLEHVVSSRFSNEIESESQVLQFAVFIGQNTLCNGFYTVVSNTVVTNIEEF